MEKNSGEAYRLSQHSVSFPSSLHLPSSNQSFSAGLNQPASLTRSNDALSAPIGYQVHDNHKDSAYSKLSEQYSQSMSLLSLIGDQPTPSVTQLARLEHAISTPIDSNETLTFSRFASENENLYASLMKSVQLERIEVEVRALTRLVNSRLANSASLPHTLVKPHSTNSSCQTDPEQPNCAEVAVMTEIREHMEVAVQTDCETANMPVELLHSLKVNPTPQLVHQKKRVILDGISDDDSENDIDTMNGRVLQLVKRPPPSQKHQPSPIQKSGRKTIRQKQTGRKQKK